MSKKLAALFLAVLMAFSMTSAFAENASVTVTDMYGREITLSEPATRIVALTPSDCEILCALGCAGRPRQILRLPRLHPGAARGAVGR